MYGMTRIKYRQPIHWPPTTGVHNLLIFSLSLQSRCILQCDQCGCLKWQRVGARQTVIPRESLWVALLRTEKTPALQATFLSALTTLPEFIISKLFLYVYHSLYVGTTWAPKGSVRLFYGRARSVVGGVTPLQSWMRDLKRKYCQNWQEQD